MNDESFEYKHRFVIIINENEIPVSPGDFYRMRERGDFVSWKIDGNDFAKVIGIASDGKIYVSEKLDDEMTDKECREYYARKGASEKTFDDKVISTDEYLKDCPKGTWSY